ncbi:MAG: ROK family transcriptional regulator [Acetivibrionales bacterium]|jgi:N-acetylglucosamine repressor
MKPNKLSRSENNKIVRKKNIQTLLRLIRKLEPVTTETLVEKSGLSYPTVFGIIKELINAGMLEKQGYASSTGGRPPVLYSICANCNYTMGVHIYSRWISLTISNISGGKVYETNEHKNVLDMDGCQVLNILKYKILKASRDTNIPFDKLAGICITLPEFLHNRLFSTTSGESASVLVETVENLTGAETSVVYDSTMLNFLERKKLAHSKLDSYIHVAFGLSIGVTAYRYTKGNDYIIETRDMFEHIIVVPDGALCRCGKRGCLETYYNGPALFGHYAAECALRGIAPSDYDELAKNGLFRTLLFRCLHNDEAAVKAVNGAIKMLGISLANLIITLGISTVVVSGLFNSNDISFFNALSEYVRDNLTGAMKEKAELILGMALPEDCSYGACLMLNQKYFDHYHKANRTNFEQ